MRPGCTLSRPRNAAAVPSEAQVSEARRLRRLDPKTYSWTALAKLFGVSRMGLRCRADPEYGKLRRRISAECRRKSRAERDAAPLISPEKAAIFERLREIPEDTRSVTARAFGDPLPGRSALDQKRAEGKEMRA